MQKLIKAVFITSLVLGFITSCKPAELAGISYQMILDENNNWKRDAGESGLKDVQITLIDDSGQTLEQAVSDTQGYVSLKQSLEENSLLFEGVLSDNQRLRCQPSNDHSLCQIVSSYEITKTGDITRFSTRVNYAQDDAEENQASIKLFSNHLDLGQTTLVGLRFRQVIIPRDATITKAYLIFNAQDTHSTDASFTITAHLVGDSPAFNTTQKNLSSRPKTTNQISWSVPAWVANKNSTSPDLSQIVQEVIGQPDWQSNQSMSFIITGSGLRLAKAFEKASAWAPELVIEYQIPPPPSNPNSFTAIASSPTQVDLSWENVSGASSYSLERKPYAGNYTTLASITTLNYTDTTVNPDTFYSYRLKAINVQGSSPGLDVQVTTPPTGILGGVNAATQGVFGPVVDWPLVATHAALLPDGRVISWYSNDRIGIYRGSFDPQYHQSSIVDLWNPKTNQHAEFNNATTDMFCAGWTVLNNGQFLVAGGNLGTPNGSNHLNLFDPNSNTWTRGIDMQAGRWYPSVTKLANGEILISGGTDQFGQHNQIHEVYELDGNLRRLSNASTEGKNFEHLYPWWHVAPIGKVFYSGASSQMAYLDPSGSGSWGETYTRDGPRQYGSSVMYEPGKILVMGGNGINKTAVTINLNNNVEVNTATPMHFGRTHLNATLLANGHIFVNGGNNGTIFEDSSSVYESEIWNPQTGQWTLGDQAVKPRNYHAATLLLPDATVWTAGGGGCGDCLANHLNYEIYYPPYLFQKDGTGKLATRPHLISIPSAISFNQSFSITTPHAQDIATVSLIALGATTHAFNMNQRFINLAIQNKTSGTLELLSPASGNLAPSGFYMLFIIDSAGVPSVAKILKIE